MDSGVAAIARRRRAEKRFRATPRMLDSSFSPLPKVRASLSGELFVAAPAPGRDLAVVAGYELLRDGAVLPELGPGVVRVFEQPLGETLLGSGGFLAHHAGQEPHAGVE